MLPTEDGYWIVTASKRQLCFILWQYHYKTILSSHIVVYLAIFGAYNSCRLTKYSSASSTTKKERKKVRTPSFCPTLEWVITASSDMTIKKWSVPQQISPDALTIVSNFDFTRKAHDKRHQQYWCISNDAIWHTPYDKTCKYGIFQFGANNNS